MTEARAAKITIPRIYTGEDNRSHWGEFEIDATSVVSLGQAVERSGPLASSSISFRRAPAGAFQDFHPAPRRQLVITLEGEAEYTTGDGEVRRFGPGGIFLAEDMKGQGHSARGLGSAARLSCYIPLTDDGERKAPEDKTSRGRTA